MEGMRAVERNNQQPATIPFGLLELDAEGNVVHYSPARWPKPCGYARNHIIGRNLFDDLLPVSPIKDFKNRFLRFMSFGDSVQRFTIKFPFEQQDVRVQIMLARITERTERGRERLALVRLMPDNQMAFTERAVA
jgi:photoactive yellow protein